MRAIEVRKTARGAPLLAETRESLQNPSRIDSPNTSNTSIRSYIPLEIAVEHNTQIHRNLGFVDSGVRCFFVIVSESSSSLTEIWKLC